jgi:hypothetical protein
VVADAHFAGPLQAFMQHMPALHAPPTHIMLEDSYTQPCASVAHVASVVEFAHVLPAAAQTGSALHVHMAVPAAPVQLWCGPQAAAAPYAQQPLAPRVHVARLPLMHAV